MDPSFRRLCGALPLPVLLSDSTGRIVHANAAAEPFLSTGAAEVVGMQLASALRAPSGAAIDALLAFPLSSGPLSADVLLVDSAGSSHPATLTATPLTSDTEADLVLLTLEVRPRPAAAAQIPDGEYERLVDSARSIILQLDTQGNVGFINAFAQGFFGYSSGEIVGRNVVGTIVPERDTSGRDLRRLVADLCARPEDFATNVNQNITRDGEPRWVLWTNRALKDASGQMTGVVCVGSDITAQHLRQEAIRGEYERLLSVFDAIDQPIYIADTESYEVLYVNSALRRILPEEPVGCLCYKALQGRETPCEFCTNDAIRRSGGEPVHWGYGNPLLQRYYSLTDKMIPWPDGRQVRFEIAIDITPQRQALEELQAANALLSSVIGAAPLAIVTIDNDGLVTSWSPAAQRLFGWSAEEAIGAPLPMIPGEQAEILRGVIAAIVAGRPAYLHRVPCVPKQGPILQCSLSAAPIRDNEDRVTGAVGLLADITEVVMAEEELRESERRLATLMGNLPGMVYRCLDDDFWTMQFVSQGSLALTGYAPEDLVENRKVAYADVIHPDDRDLVAREVRRGVAERRDFELVYRIVRADGRVSWVMEHGVGVRGEDGVLQAIEGFITDVTESRRAQQALLDSEERLRSIVEAAQDAIFMKDRDRRYTHTNAAMERLFGMPAHKIVGSTDADLFGAEQASGIRDADDRVLAGEVVETEEALAVGDTDYVFHAIKVPLRNAAGEIVGLCGIARDVTERNRAEEVLRAQEERYRTFIEATDDLVFLKDEQLRYLISNRANAEFFGMSPEDIIGKTDDDLMSPEAAAGCRQSDLQALAGSAPVVGYESIGERVFEVRKFAVRLGPDTRGVGAYIRDVTEARRAEEERRASEARYRVLFGEARDAMLVSDALTGAVLEANSRAERLLGRSAQRLVGMSRTGFYCADRGAAAAPDHRDDDFGSLVAEVVAADGRIVPVEITSSVIELGDGTRVIYDVLRDITDRREAEAAMRESEARYRSVFDNTGAATFTFGNDGVIALCNANFEGLSGYPGHEIVGKLTWMDVTHPDDLQRMLGYHEARSKNEPAPPQYEFRFVDRSGAVRDVFIQIGVVPGTEMRIASIVDITDRKRAQDAERLAAVGQLAAGVAHDFNNLLASMAMRAELTALRSAGGPCQELVDTVLRGTKRGAEVARNLMAFARPQEPRRELCTIEGPLEAALTVAAQQLENAQVLVRRQYQAESRRVRVDPGQMEQVFLNLFINASHAMPQGGTLTVATSYVEADEGGHDTVVAISDTGMGIAPENLSSIFEPFFTTKGRLGHTATPGTGLGLSVSKAIVESHGGTIQVSSTRGQGTVFTICFPASEGLPGREHAGGEAPVRADLLAPPADESRVGSVLVAEDEPELREMLVEALRARGHRAWGASNTQDAVDLLIQRPFDLVLTDLTMPGGGGREVAAFARALPDPPPVIVVTGKLEAEVGRQLEHLGVAAHLQKPCAIAEIIAAVEKALAAAGGSADAQS